MRRDPHLSPSTTGYKDFGVHAYGTRPMSLSKVARLGIERRRSSDELTVERIAGESSDDALNNAFEVVVRELYARGMCC